MRSNAHNGFGHPCSNLVTIQTYEDSSERIAFRNWAKTARGRRRACEGGVLGWREARLRRSRVLWRYVFALTHVKRVYWRIRSRIETAQQRRKEAENAKAAVVHVGDLLFLSASSQRQPLTMSIDVCFCLSFILFILLLRLLMSFGAVMTKVSAVQLAQQKYRKTLMSNLSRRTHLIGP